MKADAATARPLGFNAALAAIALTVLWGGNVVAMKTALGTFPPFWTAFWRMVVGLAPLLMWSRKKRTRLKPQPGEWLPLTALGLLMTVQMAVVYLGVNLTSAAYAAVLLNSHPILRICSPIFMSRAIKSRGLGSSAWRSRSAAYRSRFSDGRTQIGLRVRWPAIC